MITTEQSITDLGWELEHDLPTLCYRAVQGNFKTLWRTRPEFVLDDLRKMSEKPISGQH